MGKITKHLPMIEKITKEFNPSLIVELGVRDGESTKVFEKISKQLKSRLVSIDINDCSKTIDWEDWIFIQCDSGRIPNEFIQLVNNKEIPSKVDVLFIDTLHIYEQMLNELYAWYPSLNDNCIIMVHDINVEKSIDGKLEKGHLISAINDFFDFDLLPDENYKNNVCYDCFGDEWKITLYPESNGMIYMRRIRNGK